MVSEIEVVIKKEIGSNKFYIVSIGLVGENFVKFVVIMNDGYCVVGRVGVGVVMGSKKFKVIVVEGSKCVLIVDK